MRINATSRINEWSRKNAVARKPLARWAKIVTEAKWSTAADVAATFGRSADRIASNDVVCWVFNIAGNSYRLVAHVDFSLGEVTPRFFMTHAEYDKQRWKDKL